MAAPIIAQYNELQQLLCLHAMRYPLMEPTDAVKLIYQNEFGSGHLIRDHFACRFHLYGEYASVAHNDALPLWEPIGNGILRVNLGALQPRQLEPVYHGFLATSTAHTGSHHSFLGKLEVLSGLAGENCFAFSKAECFTSCIYKCLSHVNQLSSFCRSYRAHLGTVSNVCPTGRFPCFCFV